MFSLVFCNHFLFLYQEQFDYLFHFNAIKELIRVIKKGGSIYIYPLVNFKDEVYSHFEELIETLINKGIQIELVKTQRQPIF